MRVQRFAEAARHRPASDQSNDLTEEERKDCSFQDCSGIPVRTESGKKRYAETGQREARRNGSHWKG